MGRFHLHEITPADDHPQVADLAVFGELLIAAIAVNRDLA